MEQEKKADSAAAGVNITGGQIHVEGELVAGGKHVHEAPPVSVPALHQLRPHRATSPAAKKKLPSLWPPSKRAA
jgi:hypothetical protein